MQLDSIVSPILISRGAELEALEGLRSIARQGNGRIAVIAGEAGIGKSRLVAEVIKRGSAEGFRVLKGRCDEPDLNLPYAPVLDLLRGHYTLLPGAGLPPELLAGGPELLDLLPELRAHFPVAPQPQPVQSEQQKRRVFELLRQLIAPRAGDTDGAPRLIVFEDLHWSDDTSLEFLSYLSGRLAGTPALLLLTYRTDEPDPRLTHFLAALDRERLATEFFLERLARHEVEALLRAIFDLDRAVRADFLDALYGLTEGNPFFIEEVLKSLLASGEIFFANGRWDRKPLEELSIPRSVHDAVQRRTQGLDEAVHQILILAAVAGRRFDYRLLEAVTGQSEVELIRAVKQLIAAQLVVEESTDSFAFRHALIREAVYKTLLQRERKRLHLSVAEALEELHTAALEPYLADMAHQYEAAGVWPKTFEYARRAGERAAAMFALTEAVAHFSRALQAAPNLPEAQDRGEQIAALHSARARAYAMLGQFEDARSDHEQALALARSTRDRQREWQALFDLGFLWAARDYDKTSEYLRSALDLARGLGDPGIIAHSLNRLGNWHVNIDRPDEALLEHREALAIFAGSGDYRRHPP